jgi:hypothetical protein
MKTYVGVDVQIHVFLTSALVGGGWSVTRPDRFTARERGPGTHWTGGWVGPRNGLDDVERRQISLLPGLELRPSAVQPVAREYTECGSGFWMGAMKQANACLIHLWEYAVPSAGNHKE